MSDKAWRKTVDGPDGELPMRVDPPDDGYSEWWHVIEEWSDTDKVKDYGYTATRAEARSAVKAALDAIWAASGKVRPAKREPLAAWHPDGESGEWNLPVPDSDDSDHMVAYVGRLPNGSWKGEYWGPPEVTFWKRSFIPVDTAGLKRKAAMLAVEDAARAAGLTLPGDAPADAVADLSALRPDVLQVAARIAGGAVADGGLRDGDDAWIARAALSIVRAVDDVCGVG